MKRTPLYNTHQKLNGKIIHFGGWELPVQYTGILEEHHRVRTAAGLFDVSHMGEITVKGIDAERYIQKLITNDLSKITDGQVLYSPMCYPDGGVVDDLLIYKFNPQDYLVIVNASNTDKDFEWMNKQLEGNVEIQNISDEYAQFALQGPKSQEILQKLVRQPLQDIRFFRFADQLDIGGVKALVSRTGYTGEDGFELYISSQDAVYLWEKILDAGKEEGLVPVGLGARDTLRFEAALPLYGQEISEEITPIEAGLGRFVKFEKGEFIGREALLQQNQKGIKRQLIGFEMIDRGVPRSHYEIHVDGQCVGFVTTGSYAPSLQKNMGLALVDCKYCKAGTELEVIIRNKPAKAKVIDIPFYTKKYKK